MKLTKEQQARLNKYLDMDVKHMSSAQLADYENLLRAHLAEIEEDLQSRPTKELPRFV